MGFIPPIVAAVSSAAAGIGSAAAGAGSALAGGASSLLSGGLAAGGTAGAAGSASSSILSGLASGGNLALGLLPTLALKGIKPPQPPKPPNLGASLLRVPNLIPPTEGTFNDTLVSGSNRAANISGGKKTLLGGG